MPKIEEYKKNADVAFSNMLKATTLEDKCGFDAEYNYWTDKVSEIRGQK